MPTTLNNGKKMKIIRIILSSLGNESSCIDYN